MDYDVVIIGAGMSGLAAGIRLAHFEKRVCIVERHYAYGGLNSYYKLEGREFDVGLHAVTNFCNPGDRHAPLSKLLRQLRLTRDDFDLRPQHYSEVQFPDQRLRFSNDFQFFTEEVHQKFPREIDGFLRLVARIRDHADTLDDTPWVSTRSVLSEYLRDPLLIEMILCPVMFYGSAEEHDMEFPSFVTLFKSILMEGFARPPGGVRSIIKALVRRFREAGGTLRMRCGVERIHCVGERAANLELSSGEILTTSAIISSIGFAETMRLIARTGNAVDHEPNAETNDHVGRLSFIEAIAVLDRRPAELGLDSTIIFANDSSKFHYARPEDEIDSTSRILCCPNNYEGHEAVEEGIVRMTWLANPMCWFEFDDAQYAERKEGLYELFLDQAGRYVPDIRNHVVFRDMFTPRTIRYYTGHINGAVYGSPVKHRDGRTPLENLFVCGTDQGYLGIVGAMLSGITIANERVLVANTRSEK
ncbi:MAG: NAD(P)/FAD-dependent oxidoreductase [Planctomycetes bacterium]|nr:NAD(P)/FAD-dependent oxidoreductase [Planctomycetota bacterium]MBI3833232.1 NAD(P)/FAD-dependent oxidoreductase [Planctomycetota bacterium]